MSVTEGTPAAPAASADQPAPVAASAESVRDGIDRRLAPVLRDLAAGRRPRPSQLADLAAAARADAVQPAFAPRGAESGAESPETLLAERVALMPRVWEPFAAWWRGYFPGSDPAGAALADLWRLYLPLAQWITREKRARRPGELFMAGFNGSPGAGKTVLTSAVAVVLDQLLDPRTEGRALARSGDDWYLPKADREPLRALGWDPGPPGVSNRSLPGTHDMDWLLRNLREMEHSTPDSTLALGNFDKKADDQPSGPDAAFTVRGKVGVLLFDLWFAGAETAVDPLALPDGLQRRVAEHLPRWRPVFERMDALWAYDWPSFEQMAREREAQERLVEARHGRRGMSPEHIRAFMAYMTEQSWDWRTTSPIPPDRVVTFRAWRDAGHRVIAVRKGARAA
ncbi:kinase-like protein [Streptomyces sp. NBC_00433]